MGSPVSNQGTLVQNGQPIVQAGRQQNNSNPTIDSLPHLVLARIFTFASRGQEGLETTAAIRSTSQKWKHINDETLLPNLYYHVKTALGNHPFFQTIPAFNAIMNATPEQMKSIALFKDLSRAFNAPCLLFPEQYLTAYQQLEDTSLVTVWGRIAQQINFHEDEPIPSEAQEIRNWINNPENAEKIQAITELDLSYMNLELLPQEMRAFVNLQCLNLSCNYLKSLPEAIEDLHQLKRLQIKENQLESLPESIGDLRQLEWLDLAKNDLKSLPKSIGNLPLLTTLSLQNNHLESLPETIRNLSQLEQLSLENNNLISLPETIGNLSQLKQLSLENNNLISLPETIGNLLRLETLKLGNNKLNSLPETFGNLHQMSTLNLSNNHLERLPETIGNLQQLTSFYILNNRLESLPGTFGNLQHLGTFAAVNNYLKRLPKSFGDLHSLRTLDLSNNRLQGLPETFRNLQQQLEWLSFSGNLCLFMLNNKFSAFTSGQAKRILEKCKACQEYTPTTPLAKLCQLIHNQSDSVLLEQTLRSIPRAMQAQIQSKIEDIWAALPEHQQIENIKLLRANAVGAACHERDEILNQAIIEVLRETFSTLTQEQKHLVYDQVWDLAGRPESDYQFWDLTGKLQKDKNWGERHAEDNIIRLIDAMALVCEEES